MISKVGLSVTVFILALSNDVWVKHNVIFDAKFDYDLVSNNYF